MGDVDIVNTNDIKQIQYSIMSGNCALFDGETTYLMDTKNYPNRSIEEPETEKSVRGAKDGFNESILNNTGLIRRRIKSVELCFKREIIGTENQMDIAIAYLQNKVDQNVLKRVMQRIKEIKAKDLIMTDRALEELILDQNYNPFPLVRYSERPDIVATHIQHGYIAIICDTSSSVLMIPTTIFEILEHVEEHRQTPLIGTFIRIIRLSADLLSIYLVPVWSLSVSFMQWDWTFFIQILLVELSIELLRIATIHTPEAISNAMGLIAALLLGQFAIDLGFFSEEILLFCAVGAIGGFATPNYELSLTNKYIKVMMIVSIMLFNTFGFVIFNIFLCVYKEVERMEKHIYQTYVQVLKEELVPAMGCTEPIALAYCASKCFDTLQDEVQSVDIFVSGNIVKNVKSVIVPNTGGLKGIEASVAAGIVAGDSTKVLEVISIVTNLQKEEMRHFLDSISMKVQAIESDCALDICVHLHGIYHNAKVRIAGYHTNIVYIEKDGEVLYESGVVASSDSSLTDRSLLNVKDIYEFATTVAIEDVQDVLQRQIDCNYAIAKEGIENNWGANIGSILLKTYGDDVKIKAKAYAAAGSDARMSGCEMPVIINSGSGNQGMTASLPVIIYALEEKATQEQLYRALIISNLCTIHQKTGIGRLSAYCGAVSAGVGAGCGIAYLKGGDYKTIAHTLVNALAINSGIVCDGAKPSCAAKIAESVDAGILGYYMYKNGCQFKGGDGIVCKGVENTIRNIGRLSRDGMKETDKEIIKMMCD